MRMLHPIHYSMILNTLIILASTLLAWLFTEPLLFVVGLMLVQHMVGRFPMDDQEPIEPGEYDGGEQGMGFTQELK